MGLRDLLKGVRRKDEGQGRATPTKPSAISITNTQQSVSIPASQTARSSTAVSANPSYVKRDLWDEAYEALRAENADLIRKYEEILLEDTKQSSGSTTLQLAPPKSSRREEQLRQLASQKIEEVDLAKWKIKIKDHSVVFRDQFDKAVRVVIATKEFISSAVSAEPHAALAWAGVCIFLPLLENPTRQSQDAQDCLETVPFIVRRLGVMERLIRPDSAQAYAGGHVDSIALIYDFDETTIKLYRTILEFQIRVAKQYSESWATRYGRDVLKTDDWADLKRQITTLESKCTVLARDLSLEKIEAGLHSSEVHIQQGFEQVQKELAKAATSIDHQTMMQSTWRQTDEERKVLQLLRKDNPYEDQKNRIPKRVSETCNWILENKKFLHWEQSQVPDLLWLSAKPGSGKSVIAKTLVDERLTVKQPGQAVCYFFFKDISGYQRRPANALAAILHQLFCAIPSLVRHALLPYELNGEELTKLLGVMFDVLVDAAGDPAVTQIVCIMDALDECDEQNRLFLMEKITNFYRDSKNLAPDKQPKLKFFLTSRPYDDIQSQFRQLIQEVPTIHLSGDEESAGISSEIDRVTTTKVQKLAVDKGFDQDTTQFLLDKLLEVENRTYLWLSLIMEEIRTSHRRGNRREIEKLVSELPSSVIDAYDSILNKSRDKQLARELLHIILAAERPLSLEEMSVATALAGDLSYDCYKDIGLESPDAFGRRIQNICGLFVSIDDGHVFLIHQTAKEYLIEKENTVSGEWRHSFRLYESRTMIASVCVSLLLFECFAKDPLPDEGIEDEVYIEADDSLSDGAHEVRRGVDSDPVSSGIHVLEARNKYVSNAYLESHPLLDYAAKHWVVHCHDSKLESQEAWQSRIATLCDTSSVRFKRWFSIYRQVYGDELPEEVTKLNLAVEFNLTNTLRYFLGEGEDPNVPDAEGATPLQRAAQNSIEATELLLKAGADANATGWDAPWLDAVGDDGIEREIKKFCGTPLFMAIMGDDVDIVECLIQGGASVDLPSNGVIPLIVALQATPWADNSMEIIRMLLDYGADVNTKTRVPLLRSNSGIHLGIDVGWTPLHYAVFTSNIKAAKILIKEGNANVNEHSIMNEDLPDDIWKVDGILKSSTAEEHDTQERDEQFRDIHVPSGGGEDGKSDRGIYVSDHVQRQPEDDDDDSDDRTEDFATGIAPGATPLHVAVDGRKVKIVRLLLHNGADMHIKDIRGFSAMDLASSWNDDDDEGDDDEGRESAMHAILKLLREFDQRGTGEK